MIERWALDHTRVQRAVIGGIASLAVWELIGRLIGTPLLLPWPSYIVSVSFPSLALFGGGAEPDAWLATTTVLSNLGITISRISIGLMVGIIWGIALGVGASSLGRMCSRGSLLLVILRSFPLFSLIPLFVYWFAGNETGVWSYIAFSTLIVVATGVYQAITNVPKVFLLQAKLLGASPSKRIFTIIFPAVVPELIATFRNVLGLSWAFSLGAEYTGSHNGLGYLVYLSYTYADMGKLATLASIYCIGGLVVFFIWNRCIANAGFWAKTT